METQRLINITRSLKSYFPATETPMIVANIGGFTMDKLLPKSELSSYYERFALSLSSLNLDGVELIPQTMAPFPWHFGGQRHHNLFVDPLEITKFCNNHNYRVCLDISHSYLACNHFNWSFKEFIEHVGPVTAHLHISDGKSVDDEGLQIGDGDLDFIALSEWLVKYAPGIGFIPEIWQGHKNDGAGFWSALEKMEKFIK